MRTVHEIKAHNEARLRQLGVTVNDWLTCVEAPADVTPRSASEVAQRLVALSYMIRIGYGYPIGEARAALQALGVMDVLGSNEVRILNEETLTEQEKIDLSWQVEGAQVLAWALGLAELDNTKLCDDNLADRIPFGSDAAAFIRGAALRPIEAIAEQVDLIYRMHWYAVNCRFTGVECVLNESVVRERRRALDWIYGVGDDWDEMAMDT